MSCFLSQWNSKEDVNSISTLRSRKAIDMSIPSKAEGPSFASQSSGEDDGKLKSSNNMGKKKKCGFYLLSLKDCNQ